MSNKPQSGESADEYVARRMAGNKPNMHLEKLVAQHLISSEDMIAWSPAFRIGGKEP